MWPFDYPPTAAAYDFDVAVALVLGGTTLVLGLARLLLSDVVTAPRDRSKVGEVPAVWR